MNSLWDPIRGKYVAATPEEIVRQKLLARMLAELKFPKSLVAVEKGLVSDRRFDILCYTPAQEGLKTLLLVECKAGSIDGAAEKQALGYGQTTGAPFVCLANGSELKTLWRSPKGIESVPFLPSYPELVSKL
jgi:hypothetical protein